MQQVLVGRACAEMQVRLRAVALLSEPAAPDQREIGPGLGQEGLGTSSALSSMCTRSENVGAVGN